MGEIAARLSGGYMSGWTYPYSSGVEVTEAALNIAVGLQPGNLEPTHRDTSAERAFISIPGRVKELIGVEQARRCDCIRHVFIRTACGEPVDFPINNMGKCGNVISQAGTRRQAVAAAEKAVQSIVVRLVPATPETHTFLWGKSRFPSAFSPGEEFIRAVRQVPEMGADSALSAVLGTAHRYQSCPPRKIAILRPPVPLESVTDWHGLSLQQALNRVLDLSGALLVPRRSTDTITVGSIFWLALLRGSVQGALYLFDTLGLLQDKLND